MKHTGTILIILVLLAGLMIITKPTDQDCINQVRGSVAPGGDGLADQLEGLLAGALVNRHTITVEDCIFFKKIYGPDGSELGTGIFGTVILK